MVLVSRRPRRRVVGPINPGPSPGRRATVALLLGALAGVALAALVPRSPARRPMTNVRSSVGSGG